MTSPLSRLANFLPVFRGMRERIAEAESANLHLLEKYQKLQNAHAAQISNWTASIAEMKAILESREAEIATLHSERQAGRIEMEDLRARLDQFAKEGIAYREKSEALLLTLQGASKRSNESRKEMAILVERFRAESEVAAATLKAREEEFVAERLALASASNTPELQAELERWQQEISRLTERLDIQSGEGQALRTTLAEWERKAEQAESRFADLVQQSKTANSEILELKSLLRQKQAETAAMMHDVESVVLERDSLIAQAGALMQEKEGAKKALAAEEGLRRRLEDENTEALLQAKRLAGLSLFGEEVSTLFPASAEAHIRSGIAQAESEAIRSGPLVSLICVTLNSGEVLRHALESMKAQEYENIEILIQDGGSKDTTRAIVKDMGLQKGFISAKDKATLDGMLRAAQRAKGDIIGVCWADDLLLPHATGWAVAKLLESGSDAIYGDQIVVYERENRRFLGRGRSFSLPDFFKHRFYPPFSSSYFRRQSLLQLAETLTTFDHDEYEFWLWLAAGGTISYFPGVISEFHVHAKSRWRAAGYASSMIEGKRRAMHRFAREAPNGKSVAPGLPEAEIGLSLWAAEHEISCSASITESLKHLEPIIDAEMTDPRYVYILERLLRQSERENFAEAHRILRLIKRRGIDFGIMTSG